MTEITSRLSTALADRYKIERHLGEGGMATVYLAQDLRHDRKVAIKVLRPELAAVLGAERFVQEIKTTANLQHPHILPLFDSGRTGGQADGRTDDFLYYVMPYVEGETLRDKLNRETQLGIEEAVRITTEVADALDYAHRHDVIHRDIKPENILLHEGRPMVADFGIALAVSAAAGGRLTETGLSLGTPHYMSPEQATADKELTNRSDIYSLGAMLYEMLSGEPPHTGSSAQQIIMKIVTEEARPVTDVRKTVPPHVAAATAKSLERLAADRFESVAKFAEALTNPAFTMPATATTSAPGAAKGGVWNRLSVGLAIAVAALFCVAIWGWLGSGPESDSTVRRFRIVLPQEELFLSNGPSIALSPDGSSIVYVGPGEDDTQLWLKRIDQLTARPLPGTEGAQQPTFSPDGQKVAFYVSPRTLKVVSLGGEPPVTLVETGIGSNGMSWGLGGYIYLNGGAAGGYRLVRVPETGGPAEPVTTLDTTANEASHYSPSPLPNGKGAVISVYHTGTTTEESDIAVVDLRTGNHRVLLRGAFGWYASSGHLVIARADGALLAAPFDQDRMQLSGPAVPLIDGLRNKGNGWMDISLSASGDLIYVSGASLRAAPRGYGTPVWVDRSGNATAVETGWLFSLPQNLSLALSPDGSRLAINIRDGLSSDIWVKQLADGPLTRLTFEGHRNTGVTWSPDGRHVTFSSNRDDVRGLYQKRADGTGTAELLRDTSGVGVVWQGRWSNDGEWLLMRVGGIGANRDVWAYRPTDDALPVHILGGPYDEMSPRLSSDGRWLLYTSTESGQSEVYVRQFPEVDEGRWQVSTNGGSEPLWARSGREIFYFDGNGQMVAAEVESSVAFQVRSRRVLFDPSSWRVATAVRTYYDVSPDDQRFLMIQRADLEQHDAEVILVQNFFEELKEKVGG
jgi:serine/threonine-protein kinase